MRHARAHPGLYAVLYAPFGAVSGYLTVAIAYLLVQRGVSVEKIGYLIALYLAPQTWKFLWAPVIDTTLSSKRWYLIGAALSALGVTGMAIYGTRSVDLTVLAVTSLTASLATTLLAMAVEALMAHATPPEQRGRAAGWLQAGNFLGGGLGGGAALWLATRVTRAWITGAGLGACFLLCCLALLWIIEPRPAARAHGVARQVLDVLRDIWSVARSPRGYLATLVVFLPIGSGAASSLWSAVANDWHASVRAVELANGWLSGLISALGCLVGGYLSDRIDRKLGYVVYGLFLGLCALAMALAPHDQLNYLVFTSLYSFASGVCYAGFSAVVLEAIAGGAAATKYNLLASLSNMPIAYLTALEGWARTRHGVNAFLYIDLGGAIAGALIYSTVAAHAARRGERAQAQGVLARARAVHRH